MTIQDLAKVAYESSVAYHGIKPYLNSGGKVTPTPWEERSKVLNDHWEAVAKGMLAALNTP